MRVAGCEASTVSGMSRLVDAVRVVFNATIGRLSTQHSMIPVRAGVIGATATAAASYARGLLPRSVTDQALATGASMATNYLAIATSAAAAETVALYSSGDRTVQQRLAPTPNLLLVDFGFVAGGLAVEQLLPPEPGESLVESGTRFVAHFAAVGGAASALVAVSDAALKLIPATRNWHNRSLIFDAALGSSLAMAAVYARRRRAQRYGLVEPDRPTLVDSTPKAKVQAVGAGVGAALGLLTLARVEQVLAHQITRLIPGHVGTVQVGSPWVGHVAAVGILGAAGTAVLSRFKARTERRGDVVEAAYPAPPERTTVTAGPTSLIPFDSIGKEGRRFVVMALSRQEIEAVMGEPAVDPIRIVAGFESAESTEARAELCLAEMRALNAFDRSVIIVASPTGVGYVSYVFAETVEYLTRGDCALVMPQYALVPSALALNDTGDGANLQRLVLQGIAEHIAQMPEESRPRVVQFGESLGAQVALDVAYPDGSGEFDQLGLDAGLYLGVPFRTKAWNAWRKERSTFDPQRLLHQVADSTEITRLPESVRTTARHLMVVHHDDPVNKFGYRAVVSPPWWLGQPDTRPPKVPRETIWRPLTTFILTLVDLKNGMQFSPGTFRRVGHDYRIDTVDAVSAAFRLPCTAEQKAAIEDALRRREVVWAQRRLVARKFKAARDSIAATFRKWGVSDEDLDSMAGLESLPGLDTIFNEKAAEVLDSAVGVHAPLDGATQALGDDREAAVAKGSEPG